MSLKVRLRVDARCNRHVRYNPARDGRPGPGCLGCDDLWVIFTYSEIARKKAENSLEIINTSRSSAAVTAVEEELIPESEL
jgi:hypothetical protein